MVVRDTGGRVFCLEKRLSGSIGEAGWVDDSMIGRASVMDEEEEMEVDNIAIIMKGIEEVGTKSGESEQGITIKSLRMVMVVVGRKELRGKDSGMLLFIII